jgi:RNA polymerase sigma factor (sigma-70 family)
MARVFGDLNDAGLSEIPASADLRSGEAPGSPPSSAGSTVGRLFISRARLVRRLLRWRLRSDDDAQDATQDVFLKLWKREKEGMLNKDASSYMITSVYNAATDLERWRSYHRPDEQLRLEDTALPSKEAEPAEALFWRDAMHRLVEVLNELSPVTRQVFLLYHVDGASHVDIAQRVGLSVRSVERHMARAIAHCKERMKDYLE